MHTLAPHIPFACPHIPSDGLVCSRMPSTYLPSSCMSLHTLVHYSTPTHGLAFLLMNLHIIACSGSTLNTLAYPYTNSHTLARLTSLHTLSRPHMPSNATAYSPTSSHELTCPCTLLQAFDISRRMWSCMLQREMMPDSP